MIWFFLQVLAQFKLGTIFKCRYSDHDKSSYNDHDSDHHHRSHRVRWPKPWASTLGSPGSIIVFLNDGHQERWRAERWRLLGCLKCAQLNPEHLDKHLTEQQLCGSTWKWALMFLDLSTKSQWSVNEMPGQDVYILFEWKCIFTWWDSWCAQQFSCEVSGFHPLRCGARLFTSMVLNTVAQAVTSCRESKVDLNSVSWWFLNDLSLNCLYRILIFSLKTCANLLRFATCSCISKHWGSGLWH